MLYTFWLVDGLAIPRAADKGPLADARLLGYSMSPTLAHDWRWSKS